MARWVPFTLHIRIVPTHGSGATDAKLKSKKFEYVRDMQKTASLMYNSIESISGVELALPGGGQQRSLYGSDHDNSGMVNGTAVKPQFGETPAQVMITGFVSDAGLKNIQHYTEVQRISGGETYEGFVPNSAVENPVAHLDNLVSTLKSDVESALTADLPPGIVYNIFRLEMSGVTYGDRGYHFP